MNTKQQGSLAVAKAILYFTSEGYSVSVPVSDAQRYDIVVERDGILSRVEVKSSGFKREGKPSYEVTLDTSGGNRSGTGKRTNLSAKDCEFVFICTADGAQYMFPIHILDGQKRVSLPGKFPQFKV